MIKKKKQRKAKVSQIEFEDGLQAFSRLGRAGILPIVNKKEGEDKKFIIILSPIKELEGKETDEFVHRTVQAVVSEDGLKALASVAVKTLLLHQACPLPAVSELKPIDVFVS